jgi:hypothetical protein
MITLDDDHPFSRLSECGGFMRTLVSGEDYVGLDGSNYRGMCWERYIRGGIFGEVYSAFESWQVLRHSNLCVKLPTITMSVIITCLVSPCAAYLCVLVRINWLFFQ